MKEIKAYLTNQRDLAYVAWAKEMESEQPNLFNAKHWLERIIHMELMIKDLNNGKEKRAKKA